MENLFEYISDDFSNEFIGDERLEEIWRENSNYLSIEKLEAYLKEIKTQGANYIEFHGSNSDGGIEDISLLAVKIVSH